MEIKALDDDQKPVMDYHSNVDTSRPFQSVKEAVAIFGERFLAGEIYAPKPNFTFPKQETPCFYSPLTSPQKSRETSWKSSSLTITPRKSIDSNDPTLVESLKRLEAELEETKMELKLLKERESETEVALASLNAELHKNMSKLAQAEAAAAAKALASRSMIPGRNNNGSASEDGFTEEEMRMDMIVRLETSPTLAQVLTAGEEKGLFGGRLIKKERKMTKKKPIIPLLGDLFSRKKGSPTTLHNPLYATSHLNLN